MLRGEREGELTVHVRPPEAAAVRITSDYVSSLSSPSARRSRSDFLARCGNEAWKRLLSPALNTRAKRELREKAERTAVRVFARNLSEVLLAPPAGPRSVLAIDPGFRSGCKFALLDQTGEVLLFDTIRPHAPHNGVEQSVHRLVTVLKSHPVELIAVGNGTAGRETEEFLHDHVEGAFGEAFPTVVRVSEAGASVYSASPLAKKELPSMAVEYRGAVSIGRRLQDPLAELVKIEPAAIGVGQYQHDIDQRLLAKTLGETVETCVNAVGVEINTASEALLSYVAGLDARIAAAIVAYRRRNGLFRTRDQILRVPGDWTEEVGTVRWFLRCRQSTHPLDGTGVHPERYTIVERIAVDLGCNVADLIGDETLLQRIDIRRWIDAKAGIGEPTLHDILMELRRGGRDTRGEFRAPRFDRAVREITDLTEGMVLDGTVSNVAAFGAFVDIGVHRDGLVHLSELADRFVRDPHEVVRVGQTVRVRVREVDTEKKRISLSMRDLPN